MLTLVQKIVQQRLAELPKRKFQYLDVTDWAAGWKTEQIERLEFNDDWLVINLVRIALKVEGVEVFIDDSSGVTIAGAGLLFRLR